MTTACSHAALNVSGPKNSMRIWGASYGCKSTAHACKGGCHRKTSLFIKIPFSKPRSEAIPLSEFQTLRYYPSASHFLARHLIRVAVLCHAERWPSGRRQRFAKPSQGQKLCRGFKSRPLRHTTPLGRTQSSSRMRNCRLMMLDFSPRSC